jgi:hypothetical protein
MRWDTVEGSSMEGGTPPGEREGREGKGGLPEELVPSVFVFGNKWFVFALITQYL